VAEPPLAEAGALARANTTSLDNSSLTILGHRWRDFMYDARTAMRDAAVAYLKEADGVSTYWKVGCFVMAGHQPELFHPGVWGKILPLPGGGGDSAAVPSTLAVNNGAVKSPATLSPAANAEPYRASEPFDSPAAGEPYEERTVRDEVLFASLPQ